MQPATVLANLIPGLAGVAIIVWLAFPESATFATAITTVIGFFGFAICRMLPSQAALAVFPYFALNQWLLAKAFAGGRLASGTLIMDSALEVVGFSSGMIVCAILDRTLRTAFRQERIVEAQRAIIDRLQRAELQRQVAERSRGLSEALSRLSGAARGERARSRKRHR
jgi:hypothetical protein